MEGLIQRLNEITARLIAEEKVLQKDDGALLECHGKLDGLETLVFGDVLHADPPRDRPPAATTIPSPNRNNDNDGSRKDSDRPQLPSRPRSPEQRQTCRGETLSALQHQELFRRISGAAHGLRNRHEELKHVHDLAIIQAGRAAQRILSLEAEVRRLESDLTTSQSSYTFLKLQFKMLEVQALRYIPADDDEGLVEGFRRWKEDWTELDGKAKTGQISRCRQLRDEG
ncbi:MAG: hypothetical protein M1840_002954 [Geoglossum simile]|nr:MAG: hypothetical protein M1840_002954 [Geoglossum simile]